MQTVICAKTNQNITLIDQIANSGEGEVWTTSKSGMLAKLYHHPTPERFAKLEVMITHQPQDPNKHLNHYSFTFPQSLIKDNKGNLIGFLMPQIQGGVELIDIYNPKRRKIKKLEVDWHFLHYISLNMASILMAIHKEGYVIGDMKPQNILVNSKALPSFIDTDSFQVKDPKSNKLYHCLVGTEGYTPPELIGKDFNQIEQKTYHDNFRFAILIYQILFSYHPFSLGNWQGAGDKPDQNQLIKQGIWIESNHNLLIHNQNTIPLNIVHPEVKKLFRRCFNEGYNKPNLRPSAEEWFYALGIAITELNHCKNIDSHAYFSIGKSCYWCERANKLGTDIFILPKGLKSTLKLRLMSTSKVEITRQYDVIISNLKDKINNFVLLHNKHNNVENSYELKQINNKIEETKYNILEVKKQAKERIKIEIHKHTIEVVNIEQEIVKLDMDLLRLDLQLNQLNMEIDVNEINSLLGNKINKNHLDKLYKDRNQVQTQFNKVNNSIQALRIKLIPPNENSYSPSEKSALNNLFLQLDNLMDEKKQLPEQIKREKERVRQDIKNLFIKIKELNKCAFKQNFVLKSFPDNLLYLLEQYKIIDLKLNS